MNIKHGSSWRFCSTKSLRISHWLAFSIVSMLPMYCLASFFNILAPVPHCKQYMWNLQNPKEAVVGCHRKFLSWLQKHRVGKWSQGTELIESVWDPKLENYLREPWRCRRHPSFFPTHVKEGKWLSQRKMRKSLGREGMLKPPQIVRIHVGWRVSLPSLFFSWHIFFHEDVCTLSQDLPGPAVNKTDGLISHKSYGKWEKFNQYPEKHQIFLPLLKKNSIFKLEKVNFLN